MGEETSSPMDYAEHDRTFDGFIEYTKLGSIVCINILVLLCMFAFGGSFGALAGWVLLALLFVGCSIGMAMGRNKWLPSLVVLGLSFLAALLALS